jgi:hypothetical protein
MRAIEDHLNYYQKFLMDSWHNMTPTGYGILLVAIAMVGVLLMKGARR